MSENTKSENTSEYGWDTSMGISLYDKIRQDMKSAMIKKDTAVRDTMRLIMGAFPGLTVALTLESGKKTTRVKKPEEITDEDIQNIIRKFAKSEKTVLELKKETRSDYLELLNQYLPKMATSDEIFQWIQDNVDLSEFKSPMQAMGSVMKHYGKLADGNQVKGILQGMGKS
ncbi:MAG: GatB/YqeY domain-containing protein [Desulfobacula sp.]|nr:GatB/YqeY domain-containing protein [Desulfobacula sp.]